MDAQGAKPVQPDQRLAKVTERPPSPTAASVAFFASRDIAPDAILPSLDWAHEMVARGMTVAGTFHSPLERDVLHILLRDGGRAVMFLSRRPYAHLPEPEWERARAEGRLQIVSVVSAGRRSAVGGLAAAKAAIDAAESASRFRRVERAQAKHCRVATIRTAARPPQAHLSKLRQKLGGSPPSRL